MLTQMLALNVQIKTIDEPKTVQAKSGHEFTIQRWSAVVHGPFMYRSRPIMFQQLPKHNHEVLRYAPGDHVRVFFELDGNYCKVHKLERCNPPANYGNKAAQTYEPNPHNNLPS